jgi:ABC-type nitrate/sulfonate/bicarbonate transport system substrate-binding protein
MTMTSTTEPVNASTALSARLTAQKTRTTTQELASAYKALFANPLARLSTRPAAASRDWIDQYEEKAVALDKAHASAERELKAHPSKDTAARYVTALEGKRHAADIREALKIVRAVPDPAAPTTSRVTRILKAIAAYAKERGDTLAEKTANDLLTVNTHDIIGAESFARKFTTENLDSATITLAAE